MLVKAMGRHVGKAKEGSSSWLFFHMGTGTETKKDGSTDKGQLKLEFVVEYYCAADEGNRIKNAVVFDSHDLSNENAFGD